MNKRRRLIGTVTSAKTLKTVNVEVSRTYQHPLYHKVVRGSKIYKVHDELNCHVGDKVSIVESAPISRTKRWAVEQVLKVEVRGEGELETISEGDAA
ncbi:MAG: 30S ribosomal protein S17 [Anaerolineaceae bacterium]